MLDANGNSFPPGPFEDEHEGQPLAGGWWGVLWVWQADNYDLHTHLKLRYCGVKQAVLMVPMHCMG